MLLLVWALIGITGLFLNIFFWALIISVILSWVAPGSHNPGAHLVSQLCEPVLAPFRRLLPNLGGLDISPIFAFLAIKLLDMLVKAEENICVLLSNSTLWLSRRYGFCSASNSLSDNTLMFRSCSPTKKALVKL